MANPNKTAGRAIKRLKKLGLRPAVESKPNEEFSDLLRKAQSVSSDPAEQAAELKRLLEASC